ncbi:MAG: NAD(P)H-dependent oxidoreductase, partial [Gammaproteobacteria bacterium]
FTREKLAGSDTRLLLEASASIMTEQGVSVDFLHIADHDVPPGVFPDMTDYGYERDEWPEIWNRIKAADIFVVGTPIWLGEASLCPLRISAGDSGGSTRILFFGSGIRLPTPANIGSPFLPCRLRFGSPRN